MKLFISWAGDDAKAIGKHLREWLPLLNQNIKPYMSEEDIDKGAAWSSHLRSELDATNFGVVIVTPLSRNSHWLHFEAGAIAKSVLDSRMAPVLFGLGLGDVHQSLAMFQSTVFNKEDMRRLVRSINISTGESHAREERQLDILFDSQWSALEEKINPIVSRIKPDQAIDSSEIIAAGRLDELLALSRRQARILSNPEELFGSELLSLLTRLLHEHEGAAVRLDANDRAIASAFAARWLSTERQIRGYMANQPDNSERRSLEQKLSWLSRYADDLLKRIGNISD